MPSSRTALVTTAAVLLLPVLSSATPASARVPSRAVGAAVAAGTVATSPAAHATEDDPYLLWDRLLERFVDSEGLVDYSGLKTTGQAELDAFMQQLAASRPETLGSDQAKIAFWINAYNAVVIWQVVQRYPIDSVRSVGHLWGLVGGFFKQKYAIAGRQMSADDIEHGVLRKQFHDARIHWALVCGAFGCPRLLPRAYRAETLDQTLTEQAREFLAQPRGLQLDRDTDTLYLSSYFDWYAEDFKREAGSVLQYVARYAPDPVRAVLRERGDRIHVKIMDYDWALNDQKNGPRARRPISR